MNYFGGNNCLETLCDMLSVLLSVLTAYLYKPIKPKIVVISSLIVKLFL